MQKERGRDQAAEQGGNLFEKNRCQLKSGGKIKGSEPGKKGLYSIGVAGAEGESRNVKAGLRKGPRRSSGKTGRRREGI